MTSNFSGFFRAVNQGREPFQWQMRLAEQVAQEGWPESIKVPTGAGKTSLLEIAVFTLALQADRPARERSAPLRTFFVIDRRVVVDEAYRRACRLREALLQPTDPILAEVAGRLRAFGSDMPLLVAELRGGMHREHTWADAPNQPLLCISTVDQVGSRLLFRGYGVGRRQRPVQAAFIALDSLIILDEAHLSNPFAETVSAARKAMSGEAAIVQPLHLVQMSATLGAGSAAFELTARERKEERLAPRLEARKLVTFQETCSFEADAAAAALDMLKRVQTVAVVVNRVASARAIFKRLQDSLPDRVILLTGRIREWDRRQLLEQYAARLSPDRERGKEDLLCVVSTQTIEVGADMDFDGLVTEAASLDALRQRLGRLDRLGKLSHTEVVVLKRKTEEAETEADPIYGDSLAQTWKWLSSRAGKRKLLDCGTNALDGLLERYPPKKPLTPEPEHAPVLLPSHLEALVQTNPEPVPDPDVAVFLHGPSGLDAPDVNVVWRADLTEANREHWSSIVALAPPVLAEGLPLPVYAVRRWLERRDVELVADLEGVSLDDPGREGRRAIRPALVWNGPDESWPVQTARQVVPGCTLIIPASEGGADQFGWHGMNAGQPVPDIADFCYNGEANRRPRVRLNADLLASWAPGTENRRALATAQSLLEDYLAAQRDETDTDISVGDLLSAVLPLIPADSALAGAIQRILAAPGQCDLDFYPDCCGLVITAKTTAQDPRDDSDESLFTREITLSLHTEHVRAVVRSLAGPLGLPRPLLDDMDLAAEGHDLGKSDERFQAMLRGGRARQPGEPLLAKSEPRTPGGYRRAAEVARWPPDARHEFLSAALLAGSKSAHTKASDWDLVQYLIGAHHGFGRPWPPLIRQDGSVRVQAAYGGERLSVESDHRLYALSGGWVDRFWRLVERYGPWGLCYLEALLRRADCIASRMEEESAFND